MEKQSESRGQRDQLEELATGETEASQQPTRPPASLLFHALAFLALCLTAFNLYLLAWLWWSAGNGLWARMDPLLGSWRQLTFEGRLESLAGLRAAQLLGRAPVQPAAAAAAGSTEAEAVEESSLLLIKSARQVEVLSDWRAAGDNTTGEARQLLSLAAGAPGGVRFPHGLLVRGAIVCPAQSEHHSCLVQAASLRLGHKRGVNMDRKSLEARQVHARRLHAATGQLRLLGADEMLFEAAEPSGAIHLQALDEVQLSSARASVILNSSLIDVRGLLAGGPEAASAPDATEKRHQICVCLPSARHRRAPRPAERAGLLFAIPARLECAKFSARCARQ